MPWLLSAGTTANGMAFAMKRVHGKSPPFFLLFLFSIVFGVLLYGGPSTAFAETLGVHGDWSAFKSSENDGDTCYIGAEPEKAEGDYDKRGDTYLLVTQRPGIKELDVVSIRAGYQYREGSDVSVKIGGASFSLFTAEGHAWARDSETDKALVKAMKRGNKMVVKGVSWRGTATTDTYSLGGFTAAYTQSRSSCGLK